MERIMMSENEQQLKTWQYLRACYYPQFVAGVVKLPWDKRFEVLKEIHGDWENKGEDPVETMIEYVIDKTYFPFFCKGITVYENGSFKLHKLISANLGPNGLYDDG